MAAQELEGLGKILGDELYGTFREVLAGEEADVRRYAAGMAADALRIVKGTAAPDIADELRAQALLLAEKCRLRVVGGTLEWIIAAAKLAASVALKVGEAYLNSKIGG